MKRVLIDLTDIESWHGHHGGTQRVVYGIAKQFYLENSKDFQVGFIAFSPQENTFYETSFEPILNRVESQLANSSEQSPKLLNADLKVKIKQIIRTYVPESVKKNKQARAAAKKTLTSSIAIARKAKHRINSLRPALSKTMPHEQIVFSKDDTVLILGKPWDTPSMESALTDAKTKASFKLVQVIYDLIIPFNPHLHHPSLYRNYTQYIFEAIYASDLLLPISKCTEKDLGLFAKKVNLKMPESKVIRLADKIVNLQSQSRKPDARIKDEFIACIGTIEIRKNHTLLYYAYKLAEQQGIELPQLVIVGSRGWLSSDLQYLIEHDPKIKDKIIILDNINDQGLSWIYENCRFSVYPSFYEGWGLPVAESLANGKLCIASNVSSVPEIFGTNIDYFSPYDANACLELIIKYLDPAKLAKKEAEIKRVYKPTVWHDTFNEVLSGINEI